MFKDTTITGRVKRRELIIFLSCLIFAFLLNVFAIFRYDTDSRELYTQLHWVLLIAVILYGLTGLLRGLYQLVARLWR